MAPASPAKQKSGLKDALRMAAVMAFFLALAFILSLPQVRNELFDINLHRARIDHSGWLGALWCFFIGGFLTGVGVPRLWISVASGALFGAVVGTVLAHLASLLGATINFCIARWFMRGPLKRRMPAKAQVWYERFNKNGFRYLLYLRLFPLSNATVTNMIGGVSRMRYRDFLAATFIGYLPLTIVFAIFGSSAAKQHWLQFAIAATLLVALTVAEKFWRRRVAADVENEDPDGGEGTKSNG